MKPIKKLRNKIFALINPGKKVYCLYCKKTYRKFLHEGVKSPIFKKYKVAGGGYKLNVQCPNCYSVDRSRLLYLFFQQRTEVYKKPTKILHISPNKEIANVLTGSTITQIVGTIEPEQYMEYNPVRLDVQEMDFPDNSFDVVICCHVIEHVDDDEKAMREIYRVLKPGGFGVLQVPLAINLEKTLEDKTLTTDKQRKIAHGQVDHVRLYGLDYFDKLKKTGFRVERDNPYDNKWLPEAELIRHRLDRIEDVIVAHKD
ncbi:methyltransferase domain-containing protein [Aurantibacillus circumpalustris]|uniref:methyltransferase domain-containing protein n=1 Tax=Aurantibacillus circumpalustris TaxID=3036359 RepID=UPI00295BA1CC|nr:methyltransferase domain-containing protein [Aurantibacillus circumpalustris]